MHTKDNIDAAVYLGFDFGTRNIGVAIGQRITKTASPLTIIHAKNGVPSWDEVANLIKRWQPVALIVGVPVHLDGTPHKITVAAEKFIAELRKHFELPVYATEERLTTKSARERIFEHGGYKALQQEQIDSIAAKIILEEWLHNSN